MTWQFVVKKDFIGRKFNFEISVWEQYNKIIVLCSLLNGDIKLDKAFLFVSILKQEKEVFQSILKFLLYYLKQNNTNAN